MAAQLCSDTCEAMDLAPSRKLYLKPIARLYIHVSLPEIKVAGVSISNWEVMERIKSMVAPDQFAVLKVVESSLEFIRFEGETDTKALLNKFIMKLNGKFIKLSGFSDPLKVIAIQASVKFPTRHEWEEFFKGREGLSETNPGERPDTIIIKGLPSKWFSEEGSGHRPNEKILISVFERFGKIRSVDIPILDPYRQKMSENSSEFQTFYFGSHLHFDAYIQYTQYQGFASAMAALKEMKLMQASDDSRAACANIQVDFDRTCHLSAKNIRKRHFERQSIIDREKREEERKRKEEEEEERRKEKERQEAERIEAEKLKRIQEEIQRKKERRKAREEKRRQKKEKKRKIEQQRKEKAKQIAERVKEIEEQQALEAKRLLTELLNRVLEVKEQEEEQRNELEKQLKEKKRKLDEENKKKEEERKQKEKMEQQEKELRDKLIKNLKEMEERKEELQRELLRKQLSNRSKLTSVVLKSI